MELKNLSIWHGYYDEWQYTPANDPRDEWIYLIDCANGDIYYAPRQYNDTALHYINLWCSRERLEQHLSVLWQIGHKDTTGNGNGKHTVLRWNRRTCEWE